jgi:hypothetical protein
MYDPTDERVEEVFALLLHILKSIPDNLAKQSLARLFEEQATLELLLEKLSRAPLDPAALEAATSEHWDRVELLRNVRAENYLHALQREEF